MSRFINDHTKVVVSVADEKDDRFGEGWTREGDEPSRKPRAKKADDK